MLNTERVIQNEFIEKRYLTILSSVPLQDIPRANIAVLIDEQDLYSIIETTGFRANGSHVAIVDESLELIIGSLVRNLDRETSAMSRLSSAQFSLPSVFYWQW